MHTDQLVRAHVEAEPAAGACRGERVPAEQLGIFDAEHEVRAHTTGCYRDPGIGCRSAELGRTHGRPPG